MVDYSQHPHSSLFRFIDDGCQKIDEKRDFVQVLFSMEEAESIDKLINTYDIIFKLLASIVWNTDPLPLSWYISEAWEVEEKKILDELNCYLNENILKCYRKHNSTDIGQAIINLRKGKNRYAIQNELLKGISQEEIKAIEYLIDNRNLHNDLRKQIEQNYTTIKNDLNNRYTRLSYYLVGRGYIFDIAEIECGRRIGISYDDLLDKFKKDVERKKEEQEIEKVRKKKEKITIIKRSIVVAIIMIPLFFLMSYAFNKLGIIGAIVLIGLPGALLSYLK